MTGGELVILVVAGGLGAGLRYLVDRAITARRGSRRFPLGILIVNVIGSFALGVIAGLGDLVADPWVAIVGVGLLGGFTTFSTVSVDSARFARAGRRDLAWTNLLGTFGACVVAAGVGLMLGGFFVR
ncbi:CrcB family protein [Microbacterium marinum]|uniref:Fluoride-specific ion channel FluC n=1 Tax=Microbacterium marinum TaxID=421115 RepID=A0A7W7BP99_9MICO|nr:CrcB family protein [Microbacterium marinum]MBB4665401.1 CrcB protein [Microbacterium marinum]